MASTFTDLGLELMATGENAGTWGTKTNANLSLVEQLTGGVNSQAVTDSGTPTALTIADGALTGTAQHRVIELTGSITGNRIVTFPLLTENFYIIKNGTSGAYTVQIKAVSGSGATVTFSATDKGYKLIYLDGVATNTGVFEAAIGEANEVTLTGTQTLTNKTLTAPKIGTSILDTNGNELALLTATSSAVNEFTLANAATGGDPTISATGGDSNIDLAIKPKGTGETVFGTGAAAATITSSGAHDLVLDTNSGTNSGIIAITDGANGDMSLTPNGTGRVTIVGGGKIQQVAEKVSVDTGSGPSGTITFDVLTSAVLYNTQAATGDWTVNIRGDGSTALNTIMDTGESITLAHLATITGSEYRNSVVQIDGSTVTPEWQGGSAPSEGNINSIDTYSYTIIKTANATFTVLAAQTQFA